MNAPIPLFMGCDFAASDGADRTALALQASIRDKIEVIDFAAVEDGSAPMPETIDAIVRHLAKLYPHGGNQFCAAIEQAVRLAWRARHELQKIREAHNAL